LVEDFSSNIGEDDKTHIEEQKMLHDWSFGGHPNFYNLCEENFKTRVVHHHTFTEKTFKDLMEFCEFKTLVSYKNDDLNIVNLSIKS
jgi:hypothetical protein